MPKAINPQKPERLEKPFEPDINKGNASSYAPPKPQVPQKPPPPPPKEKKA